ncbi:MAG: DNRLRE domain-containing protein, partial [Bacteroidetes bacterium]|nr:DNRLRE domain-containing protein [Bacteroidota bacterium]
MGTKAEAQSVASEDFNAIAVGTEIGDVTGWYAGGTGPAVVTSGLAGTRGLGSHNNIFTWTAHPFTWTDPSFEKVLMEMDFKTSTSGKFDDDRMGWMTSSSSTSSDLIFGVQMDPIDATPSTLNIEGYWINTGTTKVYPSIVTLPALSNSTWYRLRTEFTKLGASSARIEVWLFLLDASGNPVSQVATGSIANTSDLGSNAPNSSYFPATSVYPAFKNYTTESGESDNVRVIVNPGPTITTVGTLTAFSAKPGEPSGAQTYSVFGRGLSGDIGVSAPAGFELSTDGTTYSPSLTLTQADGSVSSTTVYVRLNSATVGTYSGDIAHTSTGAATEYVSASGEVSLSQTVNLVASTDTWLRQSNPQYNYGGSTTVQVTPNTTSRMNSLYSWNLSSIPVGATVTAASLTFNVTDGSAFDFGLYAMRRTWVEGTSNGTSSGSSANWNTYDGSSVWGTSGARNVTSDRFDTDLWDATPSSFGTTGNVTIPLNVNGVSVIQEWLDGTLSNFGLTMQYTGSSSSSTDTWVVSSSEASPEANRPKLNITYTLGPSISIDGSLTAFTTQPGVPSAAQTYTVAGSNLTADIGITAPTGFELSTDGISYSPGLTLMQSGG